MADYAVGDLVEFEVNKRQAQGTVLEVEKNDKGFVSTVKVNMERYCDEFNPRSGQVQTWRVITGNGPMSLPAHKITGKISSLAEVAT